MDMAAMPRLGCIHEAIQSSRGLLKSLRLGKRTRNGITMETDGDSNGTIVTTPITITITRIRIIIIIIIIIWVCTGSLETLLKHLEDSLQHANIPL